MQNGINSRFGGPRIIVALDFSEPASALALADHLDPYLCRLKIGKELFVGGGPGLVQALMERGFDVFLDLKFHDIPRTVAAACRAAADLGVWMCNVHACGGRQMLEAARDAIERSESPPLLIAVTVLTSLARSDLREIGLQDSVETQVLRLASMAQSAGLDGVVCSALEAPALRTAFGSNFCLVTPGIRKPGSAADDQHRIATPLRAIQGGADFLVIGRPISRAPEPLVALREILMGLDRTQADAGPRR